MIYADLKSEILAGPLAGELAPLVKAGDWVGVANVLNRHDVPCTIKRPARDAKTVLLAHGLWRGLKAAAANDAHPAVDAALLAVELGNDPAGEFDFAGAAAKPLLDGLQATALLTAAARAELEALSLCHTSRAAQLGWVVQPLDVQSAISA